MCAILAIGTIGAVSVVAGSATAPHKNDGGDYDTTYQNFTMYLYEGSSHAPGESDVSIWYEINIHSLPEDGRRAWLNQSVTASPWVGACELNNLNHFGIDRKPPDNGTGGGTTTYYQTETDGQVTSVDTDGGKTWRGSEGIQKYKDYLSRTNSKFSDYRLSSNDRDKQFIQTERVKFWDKKQAEEDDGDRQSGEKTTFEYENMDRVIVDYSNCYTNPDKPGWYRQTSLAETYWVDATDTPSDDKSTWAGEDQYAPVTYSHWVYICECQSYDEAVDQLGEPPEMDGTKVKNSGGSGDSGTETPSDGGTATPGDGGTDTPSDGGTDTPGDGGTDTPGSQGGTDTPGSQPGTGTPGQTTTAASPGGGTGTSPGDGATDTVPGGGGEGTDGGEVTEQGTTETGQPGFGALAALLAVLSGALLMRRRD